MSSENTSKSNNKLVNIVLFIIVATFIYLAYQWYQSHLGQQAKDKIQIQMLDFDVALAKAQAHNKLVLADMSAIWCPTCRKLDSTIFTNDRVKDVIDENFVFARVDYDTEQGQQFAERYRVTGYPVLLILDSTGEKLTRLPLTFDSMEFIGNLNKVLSVQ
ncbi:thioredoxin family protein [Aliiglaciecola sp. NS0011-25]|uniref:thioredoxin family protein n=1 Tax=Aliiglaciecola sp. NS0011-25 TaxID=3127654 RepID=UPI003102AE34